MQVYADNAATTKMRSSTIDAMLPYMDQFFGNPSGLHSFSQRASSALYEAREKIAKCLNGDARGITFTSGGTEANNQAIISAAELGEKKGKKHIISTAFEHHAVLNTLKKLEEKGFEITLLDIPENGIIDPDQVEDTIKRDTCLVSVMYANNEIGTIQPIADIGAICRDKGILFHTDAVQAAGRMQLDLRKQGIDLLSISAHKFHGPKGAGVLYSRPGIQVSSIIEGGSQERGRRAGTENVPAIVGMAAAFEEACQHIDESAERLSAFQEKLMTALLKIPDSVLNGDRRKRLPGNVNIYFEGVEGEALLLLLDQQGIYASSGAACASGSTDPSHVLLALGRSNRIAAGSLRLSLGELNTEEEVDYILKTVSNAVSHLRSFSQAGVVGEK